MQHEDKCVFDYELVPLSSHEDTSKIKGNSITSDEINTVVRYSLFSYTIIVTFDAFGPAANTLSDSKNFFFSLVLSLPTPVLIMAE